MKLCPSLCAEAQSWANVLAHLNQFYHQNPPEVSVLTLVWPLVLKLAVELGQCFSALGQFYQINLMSYSMDISTSIMSQTTDISSHSPSTDISTGLLLISLLLIPVSLQFGENLLLWPLPILPPSSLAKKAPDVDGK